MVQEGGGDGRGFRGGFGEGGGGFVGGGLGGIYGFGHGDGDDGGGGAGGDGDNGCAFCEEEGLSKGLSLGVGGFGGSKSGGLSMGTSEFVLFCFYSAACRSCSKKRGIEKTACCCYPGQGGPKGAEKGSAV